MNNKIITPEIVMKDFNKLKKIAQDYYIKNKINVSLEAISILGNLMYNFNVKYTDNEVEKLLKKISTNLGDNNFKEKKVQTKKNKVIFYDYFALDNRGLTEQYLQGLIDLDYEILFITLQKNNNKMKNITKKLSEYKKAEIYIVNSRDRVRAINEISKKALLYGASKVFIHTTPWDTIGFVTWASFENKLERYLINLTDHTFGLGKCCSDYFIEFRSYGKNISVTYRGIEEEKLIILPYYPIQNKNENFQGFSFNTENKKLIFSGGSLYKIYGSTIFFELVKYILDNNPDIIFLFLGNGDDKPLKKFINENSYEDKFYFYNERRDINEIFKRCYFYLGTYPISGGLMSQFAVMNEKLPIAYTSSKLPVNRIEELFVDCENKKLTYTDIEELKKELDRLLKDKKYLLEKTKDMKKLVITPQEFSRELQRLILEKNTRFRFKKYYIDDIEFSNLYFEQENKFLNQYKKIFLTRNITIARKFLKYFLSEFLKYGFSKIKTINIHKK